ncbi:hypothetical protein GOEFS_021_00200 [Gordonia effusa NBRC 100432]|uniref:Uncharacterized protein n=1 Tax=Gordonia effusa NBRC 100432 TaxID=1077974 RepID=H0QWJ2_9ACTN|nr:hypothetical protein [Gordonia effusa]GAB17193.1 hypothetical protein GOEFS_021_00200 [Gordonia effusa NBRC 100432]
MSRTRVIAAAAAVGAAVSIAIAPAIASAAPAAPAATKVATTNALSFSIPAIGGIETPPGGVPGGSFQQTTVNARPASTAGSVTFSVANPVTWSGPNSYLYGQYTYRYVGVSWRNLQTGKTGTVDLRHWQAPATDSGPGYSWTLPTSATVVTGSGPVVATVTVFREQWERPGMPISVIPGVSALLVP